MERNVYSQLELFSETKNYDTVRPGSSNRLFFGYIRAHEKIILGIITLVIVSIFSFSLGVQKGGKLSGLIPGNTKEVPISTAIKPQKPADQKPAMHSAIEKEIVIEKPSIKDFQHNFTIQLASYKAELAAKKEADALKKKGFSPLVLSKGKYSVLCVGNFSEREKAKTMLSQFKKRYRDCILRKL